MDKNNLGTCPVDRGLMRVGDRWSMLVLRDIERGLTRYDQMRASLGIAPNILSRRLSALADAGLIAKRRYSQRPPRDEYLLTEAGRDFLPILTFEFIATAFILHALVTNDATDGFFDGAADFLEFAFCAFFVLAHPSSSFAR